MQRLRRGFTLIELLTVIAIIGILASIILVSLTNARVKGRDVERLAAVQQIRAALDQYAVDNSHYPSTGAGNYAMFDPSANATFVSQGINGTANTINQVLAPYIGTPNYIDPSGPANGSDAGYQYVSDGTDYLLLAWRTPENLSNFDQSLINTNPNRCPGGPTNGQCAAGHNNIGYWTKNAFTW